MALGGKKSLQTPFKGKETQGSVALYKGGSSGKKKSRMTYITVEDRSRSMGKKSQRRWNGGGVTQRQRVSCNGTVGWSKKRGNNKLPASELTKGERRNLRAGDSIVHRMSSDTKRGKALYKLKRKGLSWKGVAKKTTEKGGETT